MKTPRKGRTNEKSREITRRGKNGKGERRESS
jgi:hypothetical protein